jgi:hypothetical protein
VGVVVGPWWCRDCGWNAADDVDALMSDPPPGRTAAAGLAAAFAFAKWMQRDADRE